jgi:hypothetical protein
MRSEWCCLRIPTFRRNRVPPSSGSTPKMEAGKPTSVCKTTRCHNTTEHIYMRRDNLMSHINLFERNARAGPRLSKKHHDAAVNLPGRTEAQINTIFNVIYHLRSIAHLRRCVFVSTCSVLCVCVCVCVCVWRVLSFLCARRFLACVWVKSQIQETLRVAVPPNIATSKITILHIYLWFI